MYALKELVRTIACPTDPDTTFTKLRSGLRKLEVEVEYENRGAGKVVARCISLFLNFVLWRCYSDKLIFELKSADGVRTNVNVYAIPNLIRIKVGEGEKLTDLDDLVARLEGEIR
jgi:hypothetical protein